jgi:flavodoxin
MKSNQEYSRHDFLSKASSATNFSLYILLIYVFIIPFTSSCQSKASPQKILIVYLSHTKNTKVLAEIIQKKVGGKLVELELQNPYPENYKATVKQVSDELEKGFLPPLKTKIENIDQYDVIFLGFPTWAMQLPPPMQSCLHQNNFKEKTLVPFNTNGGYGLGTTVDKIKELCPNAEIKEPFSMIGGKETEGIFLTIEGKKAFETEQKIYTWLKKMHIFKNMKNKITH